MNKTLLITLFSVMLDQKRVVPVGKALVSAESLLEPYNDDPNFDADKDYWIIAAIYTDGTLLLWHVGLDCGLPEIDPEDVQIPADVLPSGDEKATPVVVGSSLLLTLRDWNDVHTRIFNSGFYPVQQSEWRWAAVKHTSTNTWCIYKDAIKHTPAFVAANGEKITDVALIRELVPCTDEVFALYDFS